MNLLYQPPPDLWNGLVSRPQASIFHTEAWQSAMAGVFRNVIPHRWVLSDGGKPRSGACLFEASSWISGRKLTTTPFHQSAHVLASEADDLRQLLSAVTGLARRKRISQIQLTCPDGALSRVFAEKGFRESRAMPTPELKLQPTYAATFQGYKKQFRTNLRGIRKKLGEDAGFRFAVCGREQLRDFSALLIAQCGRKHYNLPAPLSWMERLWDLCLPQRAIDLFGVTYRDRLISGDVILYHQGKAYYAWSATDPLFEASAVSTFLLDRIIERLHDRTPPAETLNLGPVSPYDPGLLFFKSRWGSELVQPFLYTRSASKKGFVELDSARQLVRVRSLVRWMPPRLFGLFSRLAFPHLV